MSAYSRPSNLRLQRAVHWARSAGRMALNLFRDVAPERKADQSYVTEADHSIESFLRERIGEVYPGDRILGEEEGTTSGEEWSWYLDPIDGTGSYATHLPIWCVSIGIWKGENPIHGVVYVPFLDELYFGSSNGIGFKNNSQLNDLEHDDWNYESLLCVSSHAHLGYEIDFPGKTRSMGSTAYHMALVADGRAVGAVLGHPHIWDMAGALPIGKSVEARLRTIESGEHPDWSSLIGGGEPRKPLIYGYTRQLRELIPRVSYEKVG